MGDKAQETSPSLDDSIAAFRAMMASKALSRLQAAPVACRLLVDGKSNGELWQGSLMSCTERVLRRHKITHIVNAAKDLGSFFKTWASEHLPKVKILGPEFFHLDWVDSSDQKLWKDKKYDQLVESSKWIHAALTEGWVEHEMLLFHASIYAVSDNAEPRCALLKGKKFWCTVLRGRAALQPW